MAIDYTQFMIKHSKGRSRNIGSALFPLAMQRLSKYPGNDMREQLINGVEQVPLCKITGTLWREETREGDGEIDTRRIDPWPEPTPEQPLSACLVGAMGYVMFGATNSVHMAQIIEEHVPDMILTLNRGYVVNKEIKAGDPAHVVYHFVERLFGVDCASKIYTINDSSGLDYKQMLRAVRDILFVHNTYNAWVWTLLGEHIAEHGGHGMEVYERIPNDRIKEEANNALYDEHRQYVTDTLRHRDTMNDAEGG